MKRFPVPKQSGFRTARPGSCAGVEAGGYRRLDEGSGATARDSSGHGQDGSLQGGPTWSSEHGGALQFDGTDNYVQFGDAPSLRMSEALTISAWIKPTGPGGVPGRDPAAVIVSKEGEYEVARFADDSTIRWAFANSNPGWVWVATQAVAPLDQWTHVAVTYRHGHVTTYANGQIQGQPYLGAGTIAGDAGEFRIGGRQFMPEPFEGLIREVRLYDRALSANEVQRLASEPPPEVGSIEVVGTSKPLDEKLPLILAALRISAADLASIREDAGLDAATITLSLRNLSRLHRYALLARMLQWPVSDVIALKQLRGVDTFAEPGDARQLVEHAREVRASGFTMVQLVYLFRHFARPTDGLDPPPTAVEALAGELKIGLAKIAAETDASAPDPTAERLHSLLEHFYLRRTLPPGVLSPEEIAEKLKAALDLIDGRHEGNDDEKERIIKEELTFLPADDAKTLLLIRLADFPRDNAKRARNNAKRADRRAFVLGHLSPYLRHTLSRELVVQILSDALGLGAAVTAPLLGRVFESAPDSNADPKERAIEDFLASENRGIFAKSFLRAHKAALLVKTFGMASVELNHFTEKGEHWGNLNLNKLPLEPVERHHDSKELLEAWRKLAAYYAVRARLPTPPAGEKTLIDVFTAAQASSNLDDVLATLAAATGWPEPELKVLASGRGLGPADLVNADELRRLRDMLALSRRLEVPANSVSGWAAGAPNASQAQSIREAVKAKYDEESWQRVGAPLADGLRERRRKALVAYVLQQPAIRAAGLTNPSQLFEYFLVDVEMTPCMRTTRIRQAISSVQLFVQRCLLNLEPRSLARSDRRRAVE